VIPSEWLDQAKVRLEAHVRQTPLVFDARRQFYIKWENQQVTGSFKLRGAFNKVLSLEPWERDRGLVCASAGNHGQAVALAAHKTGAAAEVFMAESVPAVKVNKMRALGAAIHILKGGYGEAETAGLAYAAEKGKTWVSPYNDGYVIAGQGTIALEILEQLDGAHPLVWLVPIGGGGLIAGVAATLSRLTSRPRLIGVQPKDNAFMYNLFYHGTPGSWKDLPSLADGLTGTVESGSVTIPMVKQAVDEILLVTEEEIARAIAFAWHVYHEVIEGSGAVTLAALLAGKVSERPALAIVTGGNINPELHAHVTARYAGETW
jgi:threonine dehydratase